MANNKEEAGKGMPRPGEMPAAKRPYATIDLRATEVEAAAGSSSKPTAPPSGDVRSGTKAEGKSSSGAPEPAAPKSSRTAASMLTTFAARRRATRVLTHAAAGAAGAALVLVAAPFLTSDRPPARAPEMSDLMRRLAEVEGTLGTRPNAGLRGRVDEFGRSLGALGEAQAKLARDTKTLEGKVGNGQEIPQELVARLTRLEDMLATMSAADPATRTPELAAFAGRLAELQKAARDAGETAKAGIARFDSELSAVRVEAGRIAQRLDSLRGEVEERLRGAARAQDVGPLAAKLATLEREMESFTRSEAERTANTSRVVLSLELANLKRVIDRGDKYADELARAQKVAASVNFKPLERYALEGAPTLAELAKSFRAVANAMLDAEAEKTDATLVDRLLAGARGIVRVRKAGHAADDMSTEAIVGRMEAALREGRLEDVLANAKTLPPKAALAGEDWVKKVQARQAVERALADIEVTLKSSLGAGAAVGTDGKR